MPQERLSQGRYTDEERALLSRYVTSLDEDIYAIINLPEEVAAVVFAYVSRSPRSFRDNLLQLLKEGDLAIDALPSSGTSTLSGAEEKAAQFHKRWVVGYGHSSVAEHAVAHVGVERVSRLASAELELANPFLSFTEYSQRYQKPVRGDFYTPSHLPQTLEKPYVETMYHLYDAYEGLFRGLFKHHDRIAPRKADETDKHRTIRLEKKAFEDARYCLPLATLTNLGLTGNGRALRDSIALLRADVQPEVKGLALAIEREVQKVLPTLLRHTEPTTHQETWRTALPSYQPQLPPEAAATGGPFAKLLKFTGEGTDDPQATALNVLAEAIGAAPAPVPDSEAHLQAALKQLGDYDVPPQAFSWVRYDAFLLLSEAAWHQLLRHCRGMQFQWAQPSIDYGFTVPPEVKAANLEREFVSAIALAEELYRRLQKERPGSAGYAVTNAHRRSVRTTFDLRQFYHLVNLRTSAEAQWDIKDLMYQLYEQVADVHPRLVSKAKRRA